MLGQSMCEIPDGCNTAFSGLRAAIPLPFPSLPLPFKSAAAGKGQQAKHKRKGVGEKMERISTGKGWNQGLQG